MGAATRTCVGCRYRHNHYLRPLTKKEAWCTKYSKLVKGKKNCIDYTEVDYGHSPAGH